MRWRLSFRNHLPGITRVGVGGAAAFCVHVAHLFSFINFRKTHESFKARATYTQPHLVRPTQKLNERNKQHRKNVCDFPLFRRNVDDELEFGLFWCRKENLERRSCALSLAPFLSTTSAPTPSSLCRWAHLSQLYKTCHFASLSCSA